MVKVAQRRDGARTQDFAIDLGTSNTLIYLMHRGIVLDEPSVVAVDLHTGRPIASGSDAKRLAARGGADITIVRPLEGGAIADHEVCESMIRSFVHRIGPSRRAHRHRTVICVPSSMTSAEQRAVREAAELAGARYVVVVEKPMAAAIGAGLPVKQEAPSMIVDVGGGTTDVAVTSLGSIVASRSIRVAGDDLDAAIAAYASRNQGLVLESRAAEAVKIEMGSACPLAIELEAEVWGRDLRTGLRRSILITTEQIRSALHRPVSAIVGVVRATLDELPPAIAAGIVKRGIVLAGGGALLHGLAGRIQAETGAPVEVAADPLRCVAIGAGRYLEAYGTGMVGHLLTAS